ncbi:uncharacterized protein LOC142324989 [Lycorma delicatula]|uniref:uncharacterized protein LOC142324989 n=1 Tax=Lycorma delicatula TaxID=130591 RepID=UPI003F5163C0
MMISLGGLKLLTVLVLAEVLLVKGQWNPSFSSYVFIGAGRQPQGFGLQPLTPWQSSRLTSPNQYISVITTTGNRIPETAFTVKQPSPNDVNSWQNNRLTWPSQSRQVTIATSNRIPEIESTVKQPSRNEFNSWQNNRLTQPNQSRKVTTATGNRIPETESTVKQPSRNEFNSWQNNRLTQPNQSRQVTTATGNRRPETGSTRQPSPNDVDSNNQNIPNYSGPVFLVPCKCPTAKNFDPVCGTDNRTYVNRSTLDCNNRCGVNVNFKRRGSCAANRT